MVEKFTIISDIHLEFIPHLSEINALTGDNLLLCGDIGKPHTKIYKEFISTCSKNFNRVFIICGNHEYYGFKMSDIEKEMTNLEKKYNNVHYMNRQVKEFDQFVIIGATLWSDIPKEEQDYISTVINDYRYIRNDSKQLITPAYTTKLHNADVKFIKEAVQLVEPLDKPVIIMTHHAPIFDCVFPQYLTKKNHAFCSNLQHLFTPSIKLWAFGHTHCPFNKDFTIPTDQNESIIHLHNNPLGYPHELEKYNSCHPKNCEWYL